MTFLDIALILFIVLETLNVFLLYKMPGSTRGNAVGVFKAYAKTREEPSVAAFVDYLINWVAGTKLIFIVLIIGVLIAGSPEIKVYSGIALVFSIATFYSRLYPALKRMDKDGQLDPRGYARTLAVMIGVFILVFAAAVLVFLLQRLT
ncbi:MAG: hypothetical protein KKI09_06765 [Spirochaetes bacterium]|nr:hypothetical protein [Spirochaetota bacterium]MBU0955111.1 hypothetical protein [Spirochaetota bacterium]